MLVTLHPMSPPDGWTFIKIPFQFTQPGMAYTFAPGCLSGYCYKYLAPASEFVDNDVVNERRYITLTWANLIIFILTLFFVRHFKETARTPFNRNVVREKEILSFDNVIILVNW